MGPFGAHLGAQVITRERLSKRLLFDLPSGAYLVSNTAMPVGGGVYEASYHEPVVPLSLREAQWQRLRANRGGLVHVFDREPNRSVYVFRP